MFKDLKSLLPKTIKRAGLNRQIKQQEQLKLFQQVALEFLSSELAKEIKPLYIYDHILTVVSLSPAAVAVLAKKEQFIIKRMNEILGGGELKRIRCLT